MYARYFKLAISCASLMFVTGIISLIVLTVTKVWPAHKGLSFKENTCRVTHSDISCESGNCSCTSDGNVQDVPCLKVYVQCGEHVEDEVRFNFSTADEQQEHLLRKDIYHLNDKVKIICFVFHVIFASISLNSSSQMPNLEFVFNECYSK